MSILRVIVARVRGFLRPDDLDLDFQRELESHLDMSTADKIRQGMPPAEARRRARIELGGLTALPSAIEMGWGAVRKGVLGPGFAADQYVTARLEVDRELIALGEAAEDRRPFASHLGALQDDVVRRLQAEPGVLGVTLSAAEPGNGSWATIELEGIRQENESIFASDNRVRVNHVDESFFDVFEIPILTGRGFEAGDFALGGAPLIVSETIARSLLDEGNPLGRRVRYSNHLEEGPSEALEQASWYEIVGVVADRPANENHGTVYHPMRSGQIRPTAVSVRLGIEPHGFADRLRLIISAESPVSRIEEVMTLDQIYQQRQFGNNMGALSLALVTLSVLLLSAAGIYALMAFTISQRRREIGIRSALGAQPSRVLLAIFRRAIGQIGGGVVAGALVALLIDYHLPVEQMGGWNVPGVVPGAAAFMLIIGALATTGPARRGLRVDSLEELREG
ncbi:MAG: permease prefix domain 1-containing protein [Thermoanaerobaculia bacterium]|nr:permease prefix domain 1-containing protein [Thermoanaerobaculia bacterium]